MFKKLLATLLIITPFACAPAHAGEVFDLPEGNFPEPVGITMACKTEEDAKAFVDNFPLSIQAISATGSFLECINFGKVFILKDGSYEHLYAYTSPEGFPFAVIIKVGKADTFYVPMNSKFFIMDEEV